MGGRLAEEILGFAKYLLVGLERHSALMRHQDDLVPGPESLADSQLGRNRNAANGVDPGSVAVG